VLIDGELKKPQKKGYPGSAAFSAEEVSRMWWDNATHVGIAMHSDWIVLDVDVKLRKRTGEPMKGEQHLSLMVSHYGALPRTLEQSTRSGGRHMIFLRRTLPQGTKFRSKAVLPDGSDSDIDIVHGGNRYLVVYDVDLWLWRTPDWPELPSSWHPAIVKMSPARPGPRRADFDQRPSSDALDDLVARVALARGGERNNTLNECVFRATTRGHRGPRVEARFRQAADDCGLERAEIDATIASARDAALAGQHRTAVWADTVKADADFQSPSRFPNLGNIVDAIAQAAILHPEADGFGISVRQLAEHSGVSKNTAGSYLETLVVHEFLNPLKWAGPGKAGRFRLKLPRAAKHWDSHPPTPFIDEALEDLGLDLEQGQGIEVEVDIEKRDGRLSQTLAPRSVLDRRIVDLRSHSAFLLSEDAPRLAPSCAPILVALEDGCRTPIQITALTGKCRETVRKNLKILLSEGILDRHDVTGDLHLTSPTAHEAVNIWVKRMKIPDRAAVKRDRHTRDREAYSERLAKLVAEEEARPDGRRRR
jgi:hypothetical protein